METKTNIYTKTNIKIVIQGENEPGHQFAQRIQEFYLDEIKDNIGPVICLPTSDSLGRQTVNIIWHVGDNYRNSDSD